MYHVGDEITVHIIESSTTILLWHGQRVTIWDLDLNEVVETTKNICICTIQDLMIRGCKCGHLDVVKEGKI